MVPPLVRAVRRAARRTELADQLDLADIDTQLQRGGGHQHPQFSALETLFGIQAQFLGQAAMVRGDRGLAQALGQMPAGALGQAPGVDEYQGGAVLLGQFGQAFVDLVPGFVAHHRVQRHRRYFDGQIAGAGVADIDDMAGARWRLGRLGGRQRALTTEQKARYRLQRFLCGGQADAYQRSLAQRFQAFDAEHQMAAAFAPGDGVDLIDDQAAAVGEHRPPGFGTEQHIERFRGGHQDMRRLLAHRQALGLAGVAGAHRAADAHIGQALALQLGADAGERFFEVDADIVGQRLERRDVEHAAAVFEPPVVGQAFAHQSVDGGEEGGEGLARTGWRGDQGRAAGGNRRPGLDLRRRRRAETLAKPGSDRGVKGRQGGVGRGVVGSRLHAPIMLARRTGLKRRWASTP